MFQKSFHPSMLLYTSLLPAGTFRTVLVRSTPENTSSPNIAGILRSHLNISKGQFVNAPFSMLATPLPIITSARDVQLQKARSPMLSTLSGIAMLVSPRHSLNAHAPMLVTLLGIVTLVRPLH